MRFVLAVVAFLMLAAPAVAAACEKPPVREPAACLWAWGDPRVTFAFDNSASTVPVVFKGVFFKATDGSKTVFFRRVPAGQVVETTRWAKGTSIASVYDRGKGDLLARVVVKAGNVSPGCQLNGVS